MEWYGDMSSTFATCIFVMPIIPYGPIITLITLGIMFWTAKIYVLRVLSKPEDLGSDLAARFIKYQDRLFFIGAIGLVVWDEIIHGKVKVLSWACFIFIIFWWLFDIGG